MQKLGDFFPNPLQTQLIDHRLKIGAVIRRYETTTTPPKIKRSIIVGLNVDKVVLAYIFINSEVNPNLFPTQDLKDLHLALAATNDRPYLSHNSFADCSQLHEENVESIKDLITNDAEAHLGELSENDLSTILTKIKTAKTISKNKKRKFNLL